MPAPEELLREELERVAGAVQPGQLRPLRAPEPGPRWRLRLFPVAAAAAVIAIAVTVASLTGPSARQLPAAAPAPIPAAMPPYYLTVARTATGLEAVVRDSASGSVTGTVPLADSSDAWGVSVTASAAERMFVVAAVLNTSTLPGTDWTLFYRLSVSRTGRPGPPARLNVSTSAMPLAGMALSPDGTRLALSFEHEGIVVGTQTYGVVQVIDLATGNTRTWTGRSSQGCWAGTPSWGTGDRTLVFPWWHTTSLTTGAAAITGIRQLDTSAPGSNLLESQQIGFPAAINGVRSAMITSGGREIVAAACHDTSPPGHPQGSVTARIIELSAADGQLLRTQTARYTNVGEQDYLDGGCALLSTDPSGSHLLVQDFGFGRLDYGAFTALPGTSPDVTFAAVGW
jgi:hypothetical protein